MKISAPIYYLRSKAKKIKKQKKIRFSEALNLVANDEGFNSWSLLISKTNAIMPYNFRQIFDFFNIGDLVLISGDQIDKMNFTIGLLVKAIEQNQGKHFMFSLNHNHRQIAEMISFYNENIGQNDQLFMLNYLHSFNISYLSSIVDPTQNQKSFIFVDCKSNQLSYEVIEFFRKLASRGQYILVFAISNFDSSIQNTHLFNKTITLHKDEIKTDKIKVCFTQRFFHNLEIKWDNQKKIFY